MQALLDRAEAALRSAGTPPTIRTLWMSLADRAGKSGDADLRAEVDRLKAGIKGQEQAAALEQDAVRETVRKEVRDQIRTTVREAVRN